MARQKPNKREKFAAAQAEMKSAPASVLTKSQVPVWWPLLPAILGFFVYANTLNHGFALDDYAAILENLSTQKGWAAIGEIFRTSYRYGYILLADELYRPLTKAIFAAFWAMWPDNATPGHVLNVALFSFTCYRVYTFTAKWWPNQMQVALLTAALFAVHPIHTEVVANIKSLDEILAFLFCLLSLDLFLEYTKSGKAMSVVGAVICYFIAFLSKESAVTFIVLFPLMAWFIHGQDFKTSLKGTLIMLVPLLLFFLIRHQVLNADTIFKSAPPSVADNMLSSAKDPLTKFTGAVAMLGLYVWKLVLPINLSFDLSYPQVSPAKVSDLSFIVSAFVLSAMLVSAVMGFRKRSLLSASLFIFFVTASVSSNIFMLIGTHYGERLMYAPSFGFCLAVSSVLVSRLGGEKSIGKLSPGLSAIAIVLVGAFSILTILRNPVWKDNTTLYASGIVSAPNSARVHYYQGLLLVKPETIASYPESSRDSVEKAGIYHLKKSVGLYAPFADAWTQLGVAYYRKKNFKESLQYYDEALKYNKYDPVVYNNSARFILRCKILMRP
jgi:hypothetical protein